jgi:hypothetical protein
MVLPLRVQKPELIPLLLVLAQKVRQLVRPGLLRVFLLA